MAKFHSYFVCSSCGYKSVQSLGKCPECGEWNTMVEEVEQVGNRGDQGKRGNRWKGEMRKSVRIDEIKQGEIGRMSTGFSEVDRVLGGGMVAGSVILMAGEPGVGKSTLLLQIARRLTDPQFDGVSECLDSHGLRADIHGYQKKKNDIIRKNPIEIRENPGQKRKETREEDKTGLAGNGRVVLYVSGEESESQIKIRFERLNQFSVLGCQLSERSLPVFSLSDSKKTEKPKTDKLISENRKPRTENRDNLFVLNETNVDSIIRQVEEVRPSVLIVDSVQTIYTDDLSGVSGSVGQVRECSVRLSNFCKQMGIPIFLVGQITKEGAIAGPKVLEHLVDVVLYFEGERFQNLRILRVTKNRFGPVDEAGIFEMGDAGLAEVANPSEIFLGQSAVSSQQSAEKKNRTGAVVTCTLEGTRPLLVEIQALTVYTSNFNPRRVFSGLDFNRCQVILAVLQKFLNIDFSKLDVYCSVSGGLKISEPAADLAIALALVSSVRGISFDAVCYGEVGLLGDVRAVNNMGLREKECRRLGFKKVLSANEVHNIREILLRSK